MNNLNVNLFAIGWNNSVQIVLLVLVALMLAAVLALLVVEIIRNTSRAPVAVNTVNSVDKPEEEEEPDEPEKDATDDIVLEEAPEEEEEEPESEDSAGETEEVDASGAVVRYNRSFVARLIQSDGDLKGRYSELKNYIMQYAGVSSRMSWRRETFSVGRQGLVNFSVLGKTLCLCVAIEPEKLAGTKFKVDDLSNIKSRKSMPSRYRITSDRKTGYAKELIDMVMRASNIEIMPEYVVKDYTMTYKSTEVLVRRGWIKVVGDAQPDYAAEQKPISKMRYNRSFAARIVQSDDVCKTYYSRLKNYILAHEDIRVQDSWKKETFFYKRSQMAAFVMRGKTLCLCLALDPDRFEDTKYKVESLAKSKADNRTPLQYRIKNERRVGYAEQLIDKLFDENGIAKIEREEVDYAVPFMATQTLVRRGLINPVENVAWTLSRPAPSIDPDEVKPAEIKTIDESEIKAKLNDTNSEVPKPAEIVAEVASSKSKKK